MGLRFHDPADLRRLAKAFGLEYEEEDNQIIPHYESSC